MLNNLNIGKPILLGLLLIAAVSSPSTVKAEDNFEAMTKMVGLMDSFFGLMNSVYEMNSDNEKAALLQMHAIEDIYKKQGKHKDAVSVYQKVLKDSNNSTIRNIAYHKMADVLKESGDLDGAVNVLNKALEETLRKTK